jgi:hypothetical protein
MHAFSDENPNIESSRVLIEEMCGGMMCSEVLIYGLEKGLSGGANATVEEKKHTAYVIAHLDKKAIHDKLIDLYTKNISQNEAEEYLNFLNSDLGMKSRKYSLKLISLDRAGKTDVDKTIELQGLMNDEEKQALRLFNMTDSAKSILRAQKSMGSELNDFLRPTLKKLWDESKSNVDAQ